MLGRVLSNASLSSSWAVGILARTDTPFTLWSPVRHHRFLSRGSQRGSSSVYNGLKFSLSTAGSGFRTGGAALSSSYLRNLSPCTSEVDASSNMPQKKNTTAHLHKLRELMQNKDLIQEPLAAYLIPSRDAHNSEYLADCDKRREFISGFSGSFGDALVTRDKALMWTDGRYYLQAAEEMDDNWTLMKFGLPDTPTPAEWIRKELPQNSLIGVDPRLSTTDEWTKLNKDMETSGCKLVEIPENLVDLLWDNRPQRPCNPVIGLGLEYAGRSTADKLVEVREKMEKEKADYLVISALDEIAWLLNWRGSDIPYNPVFFAYCIVGKEEVEVFIDPQKVGTELLDSLSQQNKNVRFHDYDGILGHVRGLAQANSEMKIWFSKFASQYLCSVVAEKQRILKLTPVAFMKAIKNAVEVQGMKNCHIRDGAAVCQFHGWLEQALLSGEVVTEVSASTKLEEFRSKLPHFMGLSFPTIAGSGENGAIIHYHPGEDPSTSRKLSLNEVFLCDSGAQFLDGTTDITRTLHFGKPTDLQRECYTRVLKGQIQLVNSIFPNKLVGNYLDSFARQALWEVGLDYMHGTGHGVGSYLNVHEGPSGISWRPYPDDPGLQENMFMSNEPGYYHEGEFGIRLENIIRVMKADVKYNFGNRGYLTFEDVTMVPIQQNMINPSILSPVEILYLNAYHQQVRLKVGDYMVSAGISVDDPGYRWLMKETETLPGSPPLC